MVFDEQHLSPSFTVCLWLWPLFPKATTKLFSVTDATTSFKVKVLEGKINVAVHSKCPVPFIDQDLLPYTWQHLCLAVADGNALIHFNNETYIREVVAMDDCNMSITPRNKVTVEMENVCDHYAYSGKMTGLRYYGRQLKTFEVEGLQTCENSAEDYVQMTNIFMSGNVSTYNLTGQQELCLPEAKEFVALFRVCSNHLMAKKLCTKVGGRLINENDNFDEIAKEVEQSLDVQDTPLFLWTEEMADEEHGKVLSVNQVRGTYHMLTYSCDAVLQVTACMLPLGTTVYRKGNHSEAMTLYRYNRRLVLLSKHGEIIQRESCPQQNSDSDLNWCLVKRGQGMEEEYAVLNFEKVIFGRNSWMKEDMDRSWTLALTLCEEGEFTCDDGSCISLQSRCDGKQDCDDDSDEGDMCTVMMPLPPSYWMAACPEPQPIIGLSIYVVGVNSVSLDTNEFKVNLLAMILWRDNRITFQNLQNETQILESYNVNSIWTPDLSFPDAHYEDSLAISTKKSLLEEFTVEAMANGQPEIDNSYEVMRFNGSEVEIQRTIYYQFTFSCGFNFQSFPFDIQECEVKVHLKNTLGCSPRWDTEPSGVRVYGKGSTLSMYSISPARYMIMEDGKQVAVKLLFTRRFSAYVMTTFLPCVILCLLAHVTLTHFKLENFNDRIMVTLSLLIVLASLFSQLSSTLPSSPVSKLVDFFFLYCIVRVSLIFLLHSFIEVSRRSVMDKEEEAGAIIKENDLTLGIKMKMAWVSGDSVDTKEPSKKRISRPRIISNVGSIGLLVTDVVVGALFSFMVFSDRGEKYRNFQAWNVTV